MRGLWFGCWALLLGQACQLASGIGDYNPQRASVSEQWDGPFLVAVHDLAPPNCPTGPPVVDLYQVLDHGSCICACLVGRNCEPAQVEFSQTQSCSLDIGFAPLVGTMCQPLTHLSGAVPDHVIWHFPADESVTCEPSEESGTPSNLGVDVAVRLCELPADVTCENGTCSGGLPPEFEETPCVTRIGEHACPADYPVFQALDELRSDTRSCHGTCTCAGNVECSGTLSLFSENACMGNELALTDGQCIQGPDEIRSAILTADIDLNTTTCQPFNELTLEGSVDTERHTICCASNLFP